MFKITFYLLFFKVCPDYVTYLYIRKELQSDMLGENRGRKKEPNPINNKRQRCWASIWVEIKPWVNRAMQSWLLTWRVTWGLPSVLRGGVQVGFSRAILYGETGVDGVVIHRIAVHSHQQALPGEGARVHLCDSSSASSMTHLPLH